MDFCGSWRFAICRHGLIAVHVSPRWGEKSVRDVLYWRHTKEMVWFPDNFINKKIISEFFVLAVSYSFY